jgi:hypothetical protein
MNYTPWEEEVLKLIKEKLLILESKSIKDNFKLLDIYR